MSERSVPLRASDSGHLKEICPIVTLEAHGIVRVDFTLCDAISLEAMQRSYAQHLALCPGRKSPVLFVGGRVAAVEYKAQRFASSPEICALTAVAALVPRSFLERHLARMFLLYHRPPYPVQVFGNENEARSWLHAVSPALTEIK